MEQPMNLKFFSDGKIESIDYGISLFKLGLGDMTKKIASMSESEINNLKRKMLSLKSTLGKAYRFSVYESSDYGIDSSKNILVNCYKSIKTPIASLPEDDMHILFFFPMVKAIMELHNLYGCRFEAERIPKWHQIESPSLKDSIKTHLFDLLHLFVPKWRLSNEEKIFRNLEFLYSKYLFDYRKVPSSKSQGSLQIGMESLYFKTLSPLQINPWLDTFEYCVDMLIKNCDEVLQVRTSALNFIDEGICPSKDILKRSEINRSQTDNILSLAQIHNAELFLLNNRYINRCKLCGRFFISKSKSTQYCSVPNNQFDNKTCLEISKESKKSQTNPVQEHLTAKSKTYRNWINNNIKAYLLYDTPEGQKIIEEMNKNHNIWHNNAQSILYEYECGRINEQAAIDSIELPPIEERSQLLFQCKDKLKEM